MNIESFPYPDNPDDLVERQINDAKWYAMGAMANIAICVCNSICFVHQGFIGNAMEWYLRAQLYSIELVKLYPELFQKTSAEEFIELGLVPTPGEAKPTSP